MNGTTNTIPGTRIVGEVTVAKRLLLQRIDAIVDEHVRARRPHYDGWIVEAVLTDTMARRMRGHVVALRAVPVDNRVGPFPWQHLPALASRIVAEVWEVSTVVPDVASPPPVIDDVHGHLGHRLPEVDWVIRLTA